jgi:hypothetical protein
MRSMDLTEETVTGCAHSQDAIELHQMAFAIWNATPQFVPLTMETVAIAGQDVLKLIF